MHFLLIAPMSSLFSVSPSGSDPEIVLVLQSQLEEARLNQLRSRFPFLAQASLCYIQDKSNYSQPQQILVINTCNRDKISLNNLIKQLQDNCSEIFGFAYCHAARLYNQNQLIWNATIKN